MDSESESRSDGGAACVRWCVLVLFRQSESTVSVIRVAKAKETPTHLAVCWFSHGTDGRTLLLVLPLPFKVMATRRRREAG